MSFYYLEEMEKDKKLKANELRKYYWNSSFDEKILPIFEKLLGIDMARLIKQFIHKFIWPRNLIY